MARSRSRRTAASCAFADDVMSAAEAAGSALGTKFLPSALVSENMAHGNRVHDCHAEPLARRALLRWLHLQIRLLQDAEAQEAAALPEVAAEGVRNKNLQNLQDRDGLDCTSSAAPHPTLLAQCWLQRQGSVLRMREGTALHLYCSSCPCGNASLRRWAKGGESDLGREAAELPRHEWPREVHPPLSRHALRDGQVQLLLKRDTGKASSSAAQTGTDQHLSPVSGPALQPSRLPDSAKNDGRGSVSCGPGGLLAPGTELPGTGTGVLLSCSDKLALWSALGVQGALLSRFVGRLPIATVTVRRKFSRPHLRRALCCRLSGWHGGVGHPTILCPESVREYDAAGAEAGSSAFGDGRAYAWWAGAGKAVCINGRTGLLWQLDGEVEGSREGVDVTQFKPGERCGSEGSRVGMTPWDGCSDASEECFGGGSWWAGHRAQWLEKRSAGTSPLCKAALFDAYISLCERANLPDIGDGAVHEALWEDQYRSAKAAACPQYNVDREELLTSPQYFVPAVGTPGHPPGALSAVGTGFWRKSRNVQITDKNRAGQG